MTEARSYFQRIGCEGADHVSELEKDGMIQLLAASSQPTLIVTILVIAASTNLFAQTIDPATEIASVANETTVGDSSLSHDAKATDKGTFLQAEPYAGLAIPDLFEVENRTRFNELRRELLDDRAAYIDRWLSVVVIVLTFFGLFAVVGGLLRIQAFPGNRERSKQPPQRDREYPSQVRCDSPELECRDCCRQP